MRFLKNRNRLRSGKIIAGQKLYLMARGKKKGRVVAQASSARRYKIRGGDSLIRIAKKFNTTVGQLRRLNKLSSNRILKGQYIFVAQK